MKPNYTATFFTEDLLADRNENLLLVWYLLFKPVYLELSILELGKILTHDFWYAKTWWKSKLFYCIYKKDDIYKEIAEDVETRFDTWNYELDRPLPKRKNKKVIGFMKDELGGKIMTKFVGLRAKIL